MEGPDLLYPALFVFSLLIVGLVLTVREFRRDGLEKSDNRPLRGPASTTEVRQGNQRDTA
jgi:hypothetical protein